MSVFSRGSDTNTHTHTPTLYTRARARALNPRVYVAGGRGRSPVQRVQANGTKVDCDYTCVSAGARTHTCVTHMCGIVRARARASVQTRGLVDAKNTRVFVRVFLDISMCIT